MYESVDINKSDIKVSFFIVYVKTALKQLGIFILCSYCNTMRIYRKHSKNSLYFIRFCGSNRIFDIQMSIDLLNQKSVLRKQKKTKTKMGRQMEQPVHIDLRQRHTGLYYRTIPVKLMLKKVLYIC